jgi:2-oxoglutarate ferredoxin oxidoreductase subunit alpha
MAGLSAAGRLPVTATSFPGFALMIESINMAYMMELPMLIILVQRLGPSTGSATVGAQGDLSLLNGLISGGHPLPVFCISDMSDCWKLPPVALRAAVDLRSPVVLLTSKEMVMTERSFDLNHLDALEPVSRHFFEDLLPYRSYDTGNGLVPPFLPVGNANHQVRLTASTHDEDGILLSTSDAALENTRRLKKKIEVMAPVLYDLDEQKGAETLVVTYGISSGAAREAVSTLRDQGKLISLLVVQTLLPVPNDYFEIMDRYARILLAEENLQGQFARLLFGNRSPEKVHVVNKNVGQMVEPDQIIRGIQNQ